MSFYSWMTNVVAGRVDCAAEGFYLSDSYVRALIQRRRGLGRPMKAMLEFTTTSRLSALAVEKSFCLQQRVHECDPDIEPLLPMPCRTITREKPAQDVDSTLLPVVRSPAP
jgi:hypothetical protein